MVKTPILVGVTGSIGMGKTTVALEISKYNFPVWNSDHIVHLLYKNGNEGYNLIKNIAPSAAVGDIIDRKILASLILSNPTLLKKVEQIIHPLVKKERIKFCKANSNKKLLIFDIPLLFETFCDKWLDTIIVVTAPFEVQRKRVLRRALMTESKFLYILSKQMTDEEKVKRADFVLNTNVESSLLANNVRELVEVIKNGDS